MNDNAQYQEWPQQMFYTCKQVANILGLSHLTIRNYCNSGRIFSIQFAPYSSTLIPRSEVQRLLVERGKIVTGDHTHTSEGVGE